MNKTSYIDKSVKKDSTIIKAMQSETKSTKKVPMPEPVDLIVTECANINELDGNAYAKARLEYLREIKARNPKLLNKAMSLLSK